MFAECEKLNLSFEHALVMINKQTDIHFSIGIKNKKIKGYNE